MEIDKLYAFEESNQIPESMGCRSLEGANHILFSAPPGKIRLDKIHRLELSKCQHMRLPESGGQMTKKINICATGEGVPSDNIGLAEMAQALEAHLREIGEQEAGKTDDARSSSAEGTRATPANSVVQKEETFITTRGYGTNGDGAVFEYEMVLEVRHLRGDVPVEESTSSETAEATDRMPHQVTLNQDAAAPVRNRKSYTPKPNDTLETDNISFVT